MRVFISGPMTGLPEYNRPAFDKAATLLAERGYDVANPADLGIVEDWKWRDYLRHSLRLLLGCDAIYTLPGWESSRGAVLEVRVATDLDLSWLGTL